MIIRRLFDRCPGLRITLLSFLGSRALIAIVGFFCLTAMPRPESEQAGNLISAFCRWDCDWYMSVAQHGYDYHPDRHSNVVFFPLYPLLMHVGSLGVLSLKHGGFLISNLLLLGAGLLLWRLIRVDAGDRAADLGVRFLFFGPVSFFFSIVYSEATFFFFATAALYGARTRRWWLAGLAGYLAALTRSVGLLLAIPLVVEFWLQERARFSARSPRSWVGLACAGLPAAGTLTYMTYMALRFGDPLVYRKAEVHWGRAFSPFWTLFANPNTNSLATFYKVWFEGAIGVAVILLAVGFIHKVRASYLFMASAYLLLYTSTGLLEAIPRYLSVIAPFYLIAGLMVARRPALELPVTIGSTACLTFATTMFTTGYWFT